MLCNGKCLLFVDSFLWCPDQLICSRADVHLLWTVGTWTAHAEISLVEEVSHPHPAGSHLLITTHCFYTHAHSHCDCSF